ncbi:MAG: hypothetical protein M3Q00_02120, partial [Pseudomonadota bacterium]|nr:hypothetical protein [Pseudomonadota bacterium]
MSKNIIIRIALLALVAFQPIANADSLRDRLKELRDRNRPAKQEPQPAPNNASASEEKEFKIPPIGPI